MFLVSILKVTNLDLEEVSISLFPCILIALPKARNFNIEKQNQKLVKAFLHEKVLNTLHHKIKNYTEGY